MGDYRTKDWIKTQGSGSSSRLSLYNNWQGRAFQPDKTLNSNVCKFDLIRRCGF